MREPPALVVILAAFAAAACGGGGGEDDDVDVDADVGTPDAPRVDAPEVDQPEIPASCVAGRAETDRGDDSAFDQVRVLYVVPSDGTDRQLDTSGQICNSVRAFATWFHERSDVYLRFDTMGGELDIGFVRLPLTDAQMRGTDPNNTSIDTGTAFVRERIERELVRMGMIEPNKQYAVYYDGSSVWACGGGAYPPLIIARVGAMYLGGTPNGQVTPCSEVRPWGQQSLRPNYIDYGMLHETVHTLGFAPDAAPNEHATGHVFDATAPDPARDLMYSPRMGMPDPFWNIDAPGGLLLDINNDDYWQASGAIDLSRSSLISPLPPDPQRPIGW